MVRSCAGQRQQCDEADNFVPLLIGSVNELNAIAAGSAVRDADREIDAHTLKCDVNGSRGIDGERPTTSSFIPSVLISVQRPKSVDSSSDRRMGRSTANRGAR